MVVVWCVVGAGGVWGWGEGVLLHLGVCLLVVRISWVGPLW